MNHTTCICPRRVFHLYKAINLYRCLTEPVNKYLFRGKKSSSHSHVFIPVPIKPSSNESNIGAEITEIISRADIMRLLGKFYQKREIRQACLENGIDEALFQKTFVNFRQFCCEQNLSVDLHIIFVDILHDAKCVEDILPYFINHARQIFPHLNCINELKKISDLRCPPNWYPQARSKKRKFIFHGGPTNSGKTFHALQRFMGSKSGVYCGPLKMLAVEVFHKANDNETKCDLITGEERIYASENDEPSPHVACTVEMTSINNDYEVAVIDEIQMLRDPQRGWAWTRALLGLCADEIHLCGETTALQLIQDICSVTGEPIEVKTYKRLTQLHIEDSALGNLRNVQPGDCIVCFNKNDIYSVSGEVERLGHDCAVIYGGLPPGTKLAQAKRFNDPEDKCKILVATDAIGMGLNLSIRRVIFYSIMKPTMNEKGEKTMSCISTSQALQIAGRAGRFGTQFQEGFVTTYNPSDLNTLKELLSCDLECIAKAGLHPTADQIELYAYHLPQATLSNLVDIFITLSTMDDSLYFMCSIEDFKYLADMIQHIALPLRARYVFCCAPINRKMVFVCTIFMKFAQRYSVNEPVTSDWLSTIINWPFSTPVTIMELVHLEAVFDVLDLYLWLSYRFSDLFPHSSVVRQMQKQLDLKIQKGVVNITSLVRAGKHKGPESNVKPSIRQEDSVADEDEICDDDMEKVKDLHPEFGGGKLTQRLLAQGLITPSMLKELQKEWKSFDAGTKRKYPNHRKKK